MQELTTKPNFSEGNLNRQIIQKINNTYIVDEFDGKSVAGEADDKAFNPGAQDMFLHSRAQQRAQDNQHFRQQQELKAWRLRTH